MRTLIEMPHYVKQNYFGMFRDEADVENDICLVILIFHYLLLFFILSSVSMRFFKKSILFVPVSLHLKEYY